MRYGSVAIGAMLGANLRFVVASSVADAGAQSSLRHLPDQCLGRVRHRAVPGSPGRSDRHQSALASLFRDRLLGRVHHVQQLHVGSHDTGAIR